MVHTAAATAAGTTRSAGRAAPRLAPLALTGLCLVYVALAVLPAARGSNLVLATAGGSPGWLLGGRPPRVVLSGHAEAGTACHSCIQTLGARIVTFLSGKPCARSDRKCPGEPAP